MAAGSGADHQQILGAEASGGSCPDGRGPRPAAALAPNAAGTRVPVRIAAAAGTDGCMGLLRNGWREATIAPLRLRGISGRG